MLNKPKERTFYLFLVNGERIGSIQKSLLSLLPKEFLGREKNFFSSSGFIHSFLSNNHFANRNRLLRRTQYRLSPLSLLAPRLLITTQAVGQVDCIIRGSGYS